MLERFLAGGSACYDIRDAIEQRFNIRTDWVQESDPFGRATTSPQGLFFAQGKDNLVI